MNRKGERLTQRTALCPHQDANAEHSAAFGPGLPGSPKIEKNLTQNFLGWLGHTGSTVWEGTSHLNLVLGPHPDCWSVLIPSRGRLLPSICVPRPRALPLPVRLPGGLPVYRCDPLPVGRGSESHQASALPQPQCPFPNGTEGESPAAKPRPGQLGLGQGSATPSQPPVLGRIWVLLLSPLVAPCKVTLLPLLAVSKPPPPTPQHAPPVCHKARNCDFGIVHVRYHAKRGTLQKMLLLILVFYYFL